MSVLNMKNLKNCLGCGACIQKCPQNCLKIGKDIEGFYYPIILQDTCIKCGLCEAVCPILSPIPIENDLIEAYVAYDYSKERLKSSSGGIFGILCKIILKDNGIIFGVQWGKNWLAEHVAINTNEGIDYLRGSKYIQSEVGNTFIQAETYLQKGLPVLFSGTSCQISGLKKYLGREYSNLYTIDVFCHGVPSINIWESYIRYLIDKNGSYIKSINLRSKIDNSWNQYCTVFVFENGKIEKHKFSEDDFMKLFLSNTCLRPSCYNCQFKNIHRCSDISLGDAWEIDDFLPEMNDDKGISAVLIHTEKGRVLFDSIKKYVCSEQVNVADILPPTSDARRSIPVPKLRKKVMKKVRNGETFSNILSCLKPSLITRFRYKIGLLK